MANNKEENIPEQTQHKTGVSEKGTDGNKKTFSIEAPSVSLPKGGGAIRSIDEKFSVNAVNGTSSFSIPVPVSSARGFAPSLSLSYNSGSGNGTFGVGWSLSISSIRRKTEKELPQYFDPIDSDTYIISEAEDLVPEFRKSDKINFDIDKNGNYILNEFPSKDGVNLAIDDNFIVRRYRPRIEGLFSRMERWTEKSSGNIHWRIISKDNVTTIYGLTPLSKIADPANVLHIFEWLPDFTYDDKGNCCLYEYKIEDGVGLPVVLHNNNRVDGNSIKFTNTYLKRIWCGNKTPYKSQDKNFPTSDDFMFETALDYGDHDQKNIPFPDLTNPWSFRTDAFSSYRSGFEIRTCRLCNRFLLYHHFNELPGNSALVKSLDLAYDNNGIDGFTFLRTATLTGYTQHDDGTYTQKAFPPFSFEYQQFAWNTDIQNISPESLIGAPSGIDDSNYQFTDLYSEGLSGILSEQGTGWFYKNNLGGGNFTPAKLVMPKPSFNGLQRQLQLTELEADGSKQIINWQSEPKGFFELNDDNEWEPFVAFESVPNIDFRDPNTRQVDLNGDGIADLLITEDEVFRWYPSKGKTGYDTSNTVARLYDEEKGPAVIFADATQSIFLADMSGDGLTDIVRIRNSDVCYWPNLGYGRFGAKVAMDTAPVFDYEDNFNPQYIKLADIDGSGTSDIIYLGQNHFCIWLNRQGNSFATAPKIIDTFPQINNDVKISTIDLLGTGLICIVWNSNLPGDVDAPLRYIDLMNSQKPHILTKYKNNLGKEVLLQYTPSTQFYIADKLAGTPWVTKLHFPVHCVSLVTTYDRIRKMRFASEYIYHHGYYDHPEREFRGFGRVDQTDSETIANFIIESIGAANNIKEQDLQQPPVLTRSWFHTGAFLRGDKILNQFVNEYFKNTSVPEKILPEPLLPAGLTIDEYRQAFRACKGFMLRKEVYALDANNNPGNPYITEQHNCLIKNIQPQGLNKYGIFLAHENESITYHYELNPQDPRIAESFIFDIDNYGNVLSSADVVYPRKTNPLPADEQQQLHIVYTENSFTNDIQENFGYRSPLPSSAIKYEVTGTTLTGYFQISDVRKKCIEATVIDFETKPDGSPQKRIFEITRSNYLKDDTSVVLDFGTIESKALLHKQYKAAFNENTINNLYNTRLNAAQLGIVKAALTDNDVTNITTAKGGYIIDTINITGKDFLYYWLHSGFMTYDAAHFFLPVKYTDPFNNETTVAYDANYSLFIAQITDPKKNITGVERFNYRTISPFIMIDMNANRNAVRYDELGMVVKTFVMGKKGGNEGDLLDETKVEIKGASDEPTTDLAYSLMGWFNQSVKSRTSPGISETDLDSFNYKPHPNFVQTTAYETHYFPDQIARVRKQIAYSWSDGNGKEIMKKVQAKPGNVAVKDMVTGLIKRNADGTPVLQFANPRWIGTGRMILNNKGNPVKQYEPFFSDNTNFEDEEDIVQTGVTPIIHYDPLDRVIKTDFPDGTFSRVEFDPWMQVTFDQVDTVLDPGNQWYIDNHSPSITDTEPADAATRAAWLSALLSGTPTTINLDTLGRGFLSEQQNRSFTLDNSKNATLQTIDKYNTHTTFDIQGNQLVVTDAMNNPVMQYSYDMCGNKIFQNSMDAGRRWMLYNVDSKPLFSWDEKNQQFSFLYDELSRPVQCLVTISGGIALLFDKLEYGDNLIKPDRSDLASWQAKNMLGKPFNHYDTAGLINNILYDFKGNLLQTSRQLLQEYDDINPPDWNNPVATLDPKNIYNSSNSFDALNRAWKLTTPDNSVQYHLFNESGHLEKVLLNHQGIINITPPDETFDALTANAKNLEIYVVSIDYNEKAQRSQITYGNNTITTYTYDQKTFRLSELKTTSQDGKIFYQDLEYTYDPVGNITQIKDDAQQVIFFGNTVVEPANNYTYDAIYQLVKATGREHIGQNVIKENSQNNNYRDFPFGQFNQKIPAATDSVGMRNYSQQFSYDKAGNILVLDHKGSDSNSYTRNYTYNNTSANNDLNNNRLVSTQATGSPVIEYDYDVHGNMIVTGTGITKKGMPHLSKMDWNFKDELFATAQTVMSDGTPATTFYVYDAGGIRVRKITNAQNSNSKLEERIYLSGYEIYRSYDNDGNPLLERQTLHVMDDKVSIAMVETKTIGAKSNIDPTDPAKPYKRYQYSNHLGSACLELDDTAQIISYEEYHPYGTTAYQAINADINPIAKRYRYTGLERDEENGFGYHNARYYAPWLGRWMSAEKEISKDGLNLYQYAKQNPIKLSDLNGKESEQKTEPNRVEEAKEKAKEVLEKTLPYAGQLAQGGHTIEGLLELYARFLSKESQYVYTFIRGSGSVSIINTIKPIAEAAEEAEHVAHVLGRYVKPVAPVLAAVETALENKQNKTVGKFADPALSGGAVGLFIYFVPYVAIADAGINLGVRHLISKEAAQKISIEGHILFSIHADVAFITGDKKYQDELVNELKEGKGPAIFLLEYNLLTYIKTPIKILTATDVFPSESRQQKFPTIPSVSLQFSPDVIHRTHHHNTQHKWVEDEHGYRTLQYSTRGAPKEIIPPP